MEQGPSFCAGVKTPDGKFALFLDLDDPLIPERTGIIALKGSLVVHTNPTIGSLTCASGELDPLTRRVRFASDGGEFQFQGKFNRRYNSIRGALVYDGTRQTVTFRFVEGQ